MTLSLEAERARPYLLADDPSSEKTIDPLTESELIERAKVDPEAFGRLYDAHYQAILSYVYHRTVNITVAEELTSNTFYKALKALPRFRARAPFRAWLYRIASNEIRMYWRGERRRPRNPDVDWQVELDRLSFEKHGAEDAAEREELLRCYRRLHQALASLPERYQTALTLRYFEGLSIEDVVQAMEKRTGTVKSLLSRGLEKLRRILKDGK